MKGVSMIKFIFLGLIAAAFLLFVSSLNFTDTAKFVLYLVCFVIFIVFVVYMLGKKPGEEEVDLTFESY
jgi:hypothetical protein